jgi:hypothetical protein
MIPEDASRPGRFYGAVCSFHGNYFEEDNI